MTERSRRSPLLAVDVLGALNVVGMLLAYLSAATLVPAGFAVGYGEPVWPFLAAGAIVGATGITVARATRGNRRLGIREGFLVVALTWLAAAALGALPYILSGDAQLGRPLDAYFEGMSGFSTTGGSIVARVEELPRSIAIWRQLTQWVGGIGIIVLALAVLPRLRVGGRQLLEHEMPGPEIETLSTRIRDTARRVWILYIALTAVLFAILLGLGLSGVDDEMSPFQAFAHALTTIPTAGFSTKADSIEGFAAATQWVIVLFMILGGINFALMYRAIVRRSPRAASRDEELRLYAALLVIGAVVVVTEIWTEDVLPAGDAFRAGVFTAVSTMTTTGFSVADYNTWPTLALMTIVGLMFVGGSAGSTTGSVKVVRHLLVGKLLRREIDQTLHPEIVLPVRLNRRVVEERTLRAVSSFVLLYVGIFVIGASLLAIDAARTGLELSVLDAVSVSASMLSNVGPAFGIGGPLGSFEPFSDFSTCVMTGLMWLGRLEIIPIIVLFSRHYWRNIYVLALEEHLAQLVFLARLEHRQHLVAGTEDRRLLGELGATVPDDRNEPRAVGHPEPCDTLARGGRVAVDLELDDLEILLAQLEQVHDPVLRHLMLDEAEHVRGCADRLRDAEQVEVLLVAGVVDPRDHLRDAVALSRELADDQVVLIVAGDAENELRRPRDPGALEYVQLGRVAEQHLMLEFILQLLEAVRTLLDQRHLVSHGEQRPCDVRADLAAACDDRVHQAGASCRDSLRTAVASAEIAVWVGQTVRSPRAA